VSYLLFEAVTLTPHDTRYRVAREAHKWGWARQPDRRLSVSAHQSLPRSAGTGSPAASKFPSERLARKRLAGQQAVALSLAGLLLLFVTAGALAATGALTQPAGTAGCVSDDGTGPCADGRALFGAYSVAVSPNGKSVYVSSNSNAVARFNRAP
jgi:hypothetical protein